MTLPKSIIISKKDSYRVADFKKILAMRDNLKIIKTKYYKSQENIF